MTWQTIVLTVFTSLSTLIAALIGIIPLVWRIWDHRTSYLHIDMRTDLGPGDFVTVITVVENHSITKKKLDYALLLIGPENEDPLETVYEITGVSVCYTNDIIKYCIDNCIDDIKSGPDGRCLIPIIFYYSENVHIADEKVSYRLPVDIRNMERGIPYSVRFFIHGPKRLHRSTQDCFILPTGDDG